MSSEEKQFSQLDSPSNGETFVASPPPYTQTSDIPVGTYAPVITDTLPASTPLADKTAYASTSAGQPPISYQPHAATQQSAYYPTNVASAGTAPAIYSQHPGQAPYYGPGVVQFAAPINAQPKGVPLQPVQIIQRQNTVDVPDEMCCSILSTLCCCLYLGIPAMILASQANSLRHVDSQRALSKARAARGLNITSFILGTITIIAIVVFRVTSSPSTYY